jgi:2',3'-cyclic-nucleotide 2'-phosphodiesterase (5'-nucleotidase family)
MRYCAKAIALFLLLVVVQVQAAPQYVAGQKLITILATNDLHGGVEASLDHFGDGEKTIGGMALYGGIVRSTKTGIRKSWGADGGVVVVDSGDQFQGTLISNYNEGLLMIDAMNAVGMTAAVPGNHDYDFGPTGWKEDQVGPNTTDQDPRGAFKRAIKTAHFPFVSANTYYIESLKDKDGESLASVAQHGCQPEHGDVDWTTARRPGFLKPYVIKRVAGIRLALIGIDNLDTATMTTPANVKDICWRDAVDSYNEVRDQLAGQADVFVLLIHNGAKNIDSLVAQIAEKGSDRLHAVMAAHTHKIENDRVAGVPIIQDGWGGQLFGRVDLIWDTRTKSIVQSTSHAGIRMLSDACDSEATGFCRPGPHSTVKYEGVTVVNDARVAQKISEYRARIAPIARVHVAHADARISSKYDDESPLADLLTDTLRQASGADVTFWNTSGIRQDIQPGDLDYEGFFKVSPFNNHALLLGPLKQDELVAILKAQVRYCGGLLMQSGLRIVFTADCKNAVNGQDPNAALVHVENLRGEVIFDANKQIYPDPKKVVVVGTSDYLAATVFHSLATMKDLGNARDLVVAELKKIPGPLPDAIDGRWLNVSANPH